MSDFSANVQLLCHRHRSIAAVCSAVGINRAQSNRYFNGQNRPLPYNLQRLADFFGLPVGDLQLPQRQFAARRLVSKQVGRGRHWRCSASVRKAWRATGATTTNTIRRCLRRAWCSVAWSGCSKRWISFAMCASNACAAAARLLPIRFRYLGLAMSLESRLFFTDHESLTGNEWSQTVLLPSAQSH